MKNRISAAVLATAVCLFTTFASAQKTEVKDHKAAQTKTKAADAKATNAPAWPPKPSQEMDKMSKAFVGQWTAKATQEASAFGPADTGEGTETTRRGPGKMSIITDTTMKFAKGGPFSGHGVYFWDAQKKSYDGFWCDSWSPVCQPAGTGNWESDTKLVLQSEMPYEGKTVRFRHTYSFASPDHYTYTLEMGDAPGNMKRWMTFDYERVKEEKK